MKRRQDTPIVEPEPVTAAAPPPILPAPPEMAMVQRDLDTLAEVASEAARLGLPIRIRIQPQLFERADLSYRSWAGCVWTADLTNAVAVTNLRQGLDTFFRLAHLWGPTELAEYLSQVERESLARGQQGAS